MHSAHTHGHAARARAHTRAPSNAPGDDLASFQRLFEDLEPQLTSIGVAEYGATSTTLEDVFLQE